MARNFIVVGDPTSSGGRVVSGSSATDIDGKPVARVGDKAVCPQHKGAFPIVTGDASLIVDGSPVARHGDRLACGCQVLSAQQFHVFVDTGAEAAPQVASTAAAAAAAPGTLLPLAASKEPVCEECLLAGAKSAAVFLGR